MFHHPTKFAESQTIDTPSDLAKQNSWRLAISMDWHQIFPKYAYNSGIQIEIQFSQALFPMFFFQIAICHSFEKKIHIPTRQIQTLQSFGLLASLTSTQLEAPIARFPKPSFVLEKQIQTRKKTKNTMFIFCYKAVGSVSFRCVTLPVED